MGTKFRDYVAAVEASSDSDERALLDAFGTHYEGERRLQFDVPGMLVAARKRALASPHLRSEASLPDWTRDVGDGMTLEEKANLLIASSVTIFDWERYAETVKNEDAELTGLARYVQGKVIALLAVVQSGTDIPDWLFNRVLQEAATFELTSV